MTRLRVAVGLSGDRRHFGVPDEELAAMGPRRLHELSARLIRSWHPDLRSLHAMANIEERDYEEQMRTYGYAAVAASSRHTAFRRFPRLPP